MNRAPTPRAVVAATAALAAAASGYALYRRWQLRWGATEAEGGAALPGDDVVATPWFSATRGLTIGAPPERVWPWIVQMGGYTRAGWYSFDRFDNGGRPSARRIVPELQDLAVGDVMPTSADGSGFPVEAIDPGRRLVLAIRRLPDVPADDARDPGARRAPHAPSSTGRIAGRRFAGVSSARQTRSCPCAQPGLADAKNATSGMRSSRSVMPATPARRRSLGWW